MVYFKVLSITIPHLQESSVSLLFTPRNLNLEATHLPCLLIFFLYRIDFLFFLVWVKNGSALQEYKYWCTCILIESPLKVIPILNWYGAYDAFRSHFVWMPCFLSKVSAISGVIGAFSPGFHTFFPMSISLPWWFTHSPSCEPVKPIWLLCIILIKRIEETIVQKVLKRSILKSRDENYFSVQVSGGEAISLTSGPLPLAL